MIRKFIFAAAITTSATAASAELTYGTAFAKYHTLDINNGSAIKLDITSLGGGIEYKYNNFTFSGELARVEIEDVDINLGSIGAEYAFGNGFAVGLDYAKFEALGYDVDITSIFGSYTMNQYTFGAAIGDSSDLNDPAYTVYAAWDVTPTGTVGLDISRIDDETLYAGYADYELEQYDVQADVLKLDELRLVSVAGGYKFGNGLSAIASASYVDLGTETARAMSIGAQYEFVPGANVEVALGRISVNGAADDVDQVTFGLNYELGRRTSKRRSLGNIVSGATGTLSGLTSF